LRFKKIPALLALAIMADESFKAFVLDQLSALPEIRARAMFGAHGLYAGEKFFGILDAGRLFFKTGADNLADYTARDMEPFTYEMKGKVMTMSYHEVPPEILEQPQELVRWARKAIAHAGTKKKKQSTPRN
jgi:DNA transformation protein